MRKYCGVYSGLMWSVESLLTVVNVVSRPVDSFSVFFHLPLPSASPIRFAMVTTSSPASTGFGMNI
jgi:hypothetical protein